MTEHAVPIDFSTISDSDLKMTIGRLCLDMMTRTLGRGDYETLIEYEAEAKRRGIR